MRREDRTSNIQHRTSNIQKKCHAERTREAPGPELRGRIPREYARNDILRARPGFTFIELLLASAIAAILMSGVLTVVSSLSRDRHRMEARAQGSEPTFMLDLLRRDLANSQTMHARTDGAIVLVGHAGLDHKSMSANGRLVKVIYRIANQVMVREQVYLDDPIRPDRWSEIVVMRAQRFAITPTTADAEPMIFTEDMGDRLGADSGKPMRVPSRARLRIELTERTIDREVVIR